uniref:Bacterial surface antigen (D15) domain-containing protein n=1 Tax=Ananas comosus var. bracteatus TaxID=296719 RepID=A0A6V7PB85_ANACO|nr:unnamed protein product [Ananas comosus var. bracteatus]
MVVLKQESQYAVVKEDSFSRLNFQMEQGLPLLPRGSIVGDMAPHQAFTIGGLGSVRGYGEGAVGSGRSCLVANSEFTVPLTKELEGAVFMDCGTDLGTARHVPGQLRVDYAVNAFQRKTIYFGINNAGS